MPVMKRHNVDIDINIELKVRDKDKNGDNDPILKNMYHKELQGLVDGHANLGLYESEAAIQDKYEFEEEEYDEYTTMQEMLPRGYVYDKSKFIGQKRDADRNPIGSWNKNPMLYLRVYTDEFNDGTLHDYVANMIAKNMYAQVYDKDREKLMINKIVEHLINDSVLIKEDGFTPRRSNKHQNNPTRDIR